MQAQQLDAGHHQQDAHQDIGDAVDDIIRITVAEEMLQHGGHPVRDEDIIQRPDAKGDQAPAQQLVMLGQYGPNIVPVGGQKQVVVLGFPCRQMTDEVIGVKKAVHPHDD